jgi:hypothetical protein
MEGAVATSCDSVLRMESMIGRNSAIVHSLATRTLHLDLARQFYTASTVISPRSDRRNIDTYTVG